MLYTLFMFLFLLPFPKIHVRSSPIEVTRITTSHALLTLNRRRLLLLWRLVRLVRLISTLRRRRCLLLRWRRRIVFGHRRLLRRVHARGALERHALHLRA